MEIVDIIESVRTITAYRESNDSNYSNVYTETIINLFYDSSEILKEFSDLNEENLSVLKQSGNYDRFFNNIIRIEEDILNLIQLCIDSIKVQKKC